MAKRTQKERAPYVPNTTLKEIRALNNPLRQEILTSLRTSGEASVKELAERMGLDELRLYYHLKKLFALDLVKVVSTRPTATKPEAVYGAPKPTFIGNLDFSKAENVEEVGRHMDILLKLASKEYRAALTLHGNEAYCGLTRLTVRMTAEKRDEYLRRLRDLEEFVRENRDVGEETYGVTFVIAPLVDRVHGQS